MARKRFGQYFLKDKDVLDKIVDAFAPKDDQIILEIGPGTGALTERLLERVQHLTAVEFDRDLVAKLGRKYDPDRLTVIESDILNFNIESILPDKLPDELPVQTGNPVSRKPNKVRLIGNIPYNISTPLLFHLLKSVGYIHDMVFMLQKEVAQRLSAVPGSKAYGRLSVMASLELQCQCLFDVSPQAFKPPPKVESTVLRLIPATVSQQIHDRNRFNEIVKLAFSQRRKTLRNSLQKQVSKVQFETAQVDSSRRAENLTTDQFIRLSNT